jgi:hypothetical protein
MTDINREDIAWSLRRLDSYINSMSDEELDQFIAGIPICTAMIPPKYDLLNEDQVTGLRLRKIYRLEFRIQ